MTDSASNEGEVDATLSSELLNGENVLLTSSEKSPIKSPLYAPLAPSSTSVRQYRKSASGVPEDEDDDEGEEEQDEDSTCCAFNLTASAKNQPAREPDVNCNDFLSGMETSSGDGEFVKSQSLVSGGVVGSTKVSSLTDCCSGSGKEDAEEETIKVDPRKLTRRKTKSSVGVDGELKKELFLPDVDFGAIDCRESARQLATRVWEARWRVVPHHALPSWLQDNDYLLRGHRPQLKSFLACFQSIFRIHTETGNIWTHLLGALFFIGITVYFFMRQSLEFPFMDKFVFTTFFAATIICLSCSWLFHTVSCHSPCVSFVFSKLDYCGIAILIMGSFVPWLYYGFYCQFFTRIVYLVAIVILGTAAIVVSLWDKFSSPAYRNLRAGLFIGLGLSGVFPAIHYSAREGLTAAFTTGALGWLLLMAALYIGGALLYALRIPERWFPGYCDIWFQSHQIFHICVVAAAFVHYHGICLLSAHTLSNGDCLLPEVFQ